MSVEWLTAGPGGWQELAAVVIVGLAFVSLYRHLRGVFGPATSGGGPACSGCGGECGDTASPVAAPVTPTSNGTPR